MRLRNVSRSVHFAALALVFGFVATSASAQAPFLSYNFDDGNLDDFINPVQINFCTDGIIPTGAGAVDSGELLITNDGTLGIGSVTLRPDVVQSTFPAGSRNYSVKLRFNLESVNELLVYMRSRIGIDEGLGQLDSALERGYPVVVLPVGVAPGPNGALIISEFTGCHTVVQHGEWPGSAGTGFAQVDPGIPINPGEWYWLEISTQGREDGGPTQLTAKVWSDGGDPPPSPQLTVVDANGLILDAATRDPDAEVQLSLGTSYDFGQQPGATCRIDDLSFTQLTGCAEAPVKATRTLWDDTTLAQGTKVAVYSDGSQYDVSIALSDLRPAGACATPLSVTVKETLPVGWTASNVSPAGAVSGNVVAWNIALTGGVPAAPLKYKAKAAGTGLVNFQGELSEPGSTFTFVADGENLTASAESVVPVSDFGSIQHWLILGSFTRQVGGAGPGEDQIIRDYLTDGVDDETTIQPRAGDTIEPDYNGAAASTGLLPNTLGRNPGDVPTWVEWRDFDDADDRIDFEAVYGDLDEVMCYAVTYLNVSEDVVVNFGVSSDDSIHILLDGEELLRGNHPRSALPRAYQDTPFSAPELGNVSLLKGQHTLLVKVFEGGGEHNFRVGFLDENGLEIAGGPPEVEISLTPAIPEDCTNGTDDDGDARADCDDADCAADLACQMPRFHRADADGNGQLQLTDAVRILNVLFLGTGVLPCPDAADADDNGTIQLTDAVRILNVLFLGTGSIPPPGPPNDPCSMDPTPADGGTDLGCPTYPC